MPLKLSNIVRGKARVLFFFFKGYVSASVGKTMNTCLFSHSETIKINLKQFKLLGVESEWVFFTCHEHYPTDASDNQMKNTHCQSHEERLVSAPGYSLNYVHCCSLSSESLFPRYRENIRNTIPTPVSFTG